MLQIYILIAVVLYVSAGLDRKASTTEDLSLASTNLGFNKVKHTIQSYGGPHIYIIGAQKCATTSLHQLFLSHPSICPSAMKEIHYFDRKDSWAKGATYYLAHFKTSSNSNPNNACNIEKKQKFRGTSNTSGRYHFLDATPDYFTNPVVPARIHQSFPATERTKKRFILILREPAAREFSWYNHRVRLCTKSMREYLKRPNKNATASGNPSKLCADKHCAPLNCKDHAQHAALGKEVNGVANFSEYYRTGGLVASKGLYMTHLRRWLQFFPREQFFIVNLDTLLRNTTDTVQRLTRFLGIPEFPLSPAARGQIVLPHENAARVRTVFDCETRSKLYSYYEQESRDLIAFMAPNRSDIAGGGLNVNEFEPPFPEFETQPCLSGQIS